MPEDKIGANPFKFGMIGSTDEHTSLSTTREDNYFGKFTLTEPNPQRYKHYVIKSLVDESLSTYYVRVLEIPEPRWSAYDQKRFGIRMPDSVPMIVQDHAYTWPIWYIPDK